MDRIQSHYQRGYARISGLIGIVALFVAALVAVAGPNFAHSHDRPVSSVVTPAQFADLFSAPGVNHPDDVFNNHQPGATRVLMGPTAVSSARTNATDGIIPRRGRAAAANGAAGTIRTVAGSTGIGPALDLGLLALGIAAYDGAIYQADLNWNAIRRLDLATGVQTLVAGTGAIDAGHAGDGGPASSAELYIPYDVTLDAAGNIYIADTANHRIRKVDTNGIITTIAGNGQFGYGGDGGPATLALL